MPMGELQPKHQASSHTVSFPSCSVCRCWEGFAGGRKQERKVQSVDNLKIE